MDKNTVSLIQNMKWVKHGVVINKNTTSSTNIHTDMPSVIYDSIKKLYQMWYARSGNFWWKIHYATSIDGIHWTKYGVVIDVGISGEWDNSYISSPIVVKNSDIDYQMWYTGYSKSHHKIGYATSSDGVNWTKHGMVLNLGASGEWDDHHVSSPIIIKNSSIDYQMWYTGCDKSHYRTGYATSRDGVNWNKHKMVLDVGISGEWDDHHVSSSIVIKNSSISYQMWYSGYNGFHWRIGYATSVDGVNWIKHGIALNLGDPGEWDSTFVYSPTIIKNSNTDYQMWYSGCDGSCWRIGYATSRDGDIEIHNRESRYE